MFFRASHTFWARAFSSARVHPATQSRAAQWAFAGSTFAGLSLYYISQKPVFNDASNEGAPSPPKPWAVETVGLSPLVWGSNQNHLLSPERDSKAYIKSPTPAPELFSRPLRDLAFSATHAACIDAAGDVYQWGDGFFGTEPVDNRQPHLTLSGKNIIALAVAPSKIFALSTSGKIYTLSSKFNHQGAPVRQNSYWKFSSRNDSALSPFKILDTDVTLGSGERFTSISAGSDHLLALTSRGRTFTHPITPLANWHGQLGLRKISVPDSDNATKRVPHELSPRSLRDPNGTAKMSDQDFSADSAFPSGASDDKIIGFCDRLFEVPALRNVDVQQVTTGAHTSFVVTRHDGRVLAWGANEYGQLGLGANVTLPIVTVPTEVVLSRFTERGTSTRCKNIAAGGDLTYFTVERALPGSSLIDVLACGNGQWGGLGNASYSTVQGTPVKVKYISGILEYEDNTQSLKPLKPYHLSIAPGPPPSDTKLLPSSSGHALITLETLPLSHSDPKSGVTADTGYAPGRDILAWGLNQQYQLGNGKRASVHAPMPVPMMGDVTGRLMCRVGKEKVMDFAGGVVGRKMRVEQKAVAGPGVSIVYWKVV